MGDINPSTLIVLDEMKRYPLVPKRTLARFIYQQNPGVFESVEHIRKNIIGYYTGNQGEGGRKKRGITEHIPGKPSDRPNVSFSRPYTPVYLKTGKWLVMGDLHVPYHSDLAIDVAVCYAKSKRCTNVFINGDFLDAYELSPFLRDPRVRKFPEEVKVGIEWLVWIGSKFPHGEKVLKAGNHDERIEHHCMRHAPELVGLPVASFEEVLTTEELGWQFVTGKRPVYAGKLPIFHGHELRGGSATLVNPARWLFLKARSSAMCGHYHRSSQNDATNVKGELFSTWSIGCLSSLTPNFNPICNDWNWGFSIIDIKDNGEFFVDNRRILPDGSVV